MSENSSCVGATRTTKSASRIYAGIFAASGSSPQQLTFTSFVLVSEKMLDYFFRILFKPDRGEVSTPIARTVRRRLSEAMRSFFSIVSWQRATAPPCIILRLFIISMAAKVGSFAPVERAIAENDPSGAKTRNSPEQGCHLSSRTNLNSKSFKI